MPKQLQPNFPTQWLLMQTFASIAMVIATQGFVSLLLLLWHVDNLAIIYLLRLLAYVVSSTIQGCLQWQILKQVVNSLDRSWIYTSMIGVPIHILTWAFIYLGIKTLVLDEDGTVLIILAIVGAVGGGFSGYAIGNWQKYLFKERLYWRSLWHDWDRDHTLAGALAGVVTSVILITSVMLFGWDWITSPLAAFIGSICLASISQFMYGFIIGDTIYDVFKQAKLLE
jgi:membrane protein YqaA with SNARE-associated domain